MNAFHITADDIELLAFIGFLHDLAKLTEGRYFELKYANAVYEDEELPTNAIIYDSTRPKIIGKDYTAYEIVANKSDDKINYIESGSFYSIGAVVKSDEQYILVRFLNSYEIKIRNGKIEW